MNRTNYSKPTVEVIKFDNNSDFLTCSGEYHPEPLHPNPPTPPIPGPGPHGPGGPGGPGGPHKPGPHHP